MVIKRVIYNMHSISICILFNPKLIWSFSLVILWSVISRYRYLWFHKIPHLDWWPLSFISEVLWLCDVEFYERIPYVWSVLVYIFTRVYWVVNAQLWCHVLQKDVYMYYGLSNYYQNHRRYVRSRDDNQIHGDTVSASTLNSDCEPYRTKSISSSDSRPIAPCGAIANSLFNGKYMKMHW